MYLCFFFSTKLLTSTIHTFFRRVLQKLGVDRRGWGDGWKSQGEKFVHGAGWDMSEMKTMSKSSTLNFPSMKNSPYIFHVEYILLEKSSDTLTESNLHPNSHDFSIWTTGVWENLQCEPSRLKLVAFFPELSCQQIIFHQYTQVQKRWRGHRVISNPLKSSTQTTPKAFAYF